MPTYLTVKHLAEIFHRDEQTIRRWVDEGKEIRFDGRVYVPEKDPGGAWLFVVHALSVQGEPQIPVAITAKRRRVISAGVK